MTENNNEKNNNEKKYTQAMASAVICQTYPS
jgi:hypothetical protein